MYMFGWFYQCFHFGMFTGQCHVLRIPVIQFFRQSFILYVWPFQVSSFIIKCIDIIVSNKFRTFCYLQESSFATITQSFHLNWTLNLWNYKFTMDFFHSVFVSISAESMSLFWMNVIKSIAVFVSSSDKPIFFPTSAHFSGVFLMNSFFGKYRAEHSYTEINKISNQYFKTQIQMQTQKVCSIAHEYFSLTATTPNNNKITNLVMFWKRSI